ncbi:3-deoxy-D-manno-octulosonic acid transferase [Desertivirga xinjiangensis]|uniref:3-deoxy-D-manno-octulosonic acid transferase n=1 Tax=Desertivirga xinjiangensis TaxID=539206 RepID=UPI00210A206E|nr:glycosyltransferase N-terminal domain-containing protein [Pedobacter xinjiangensis]
MLLLYNFGIKIYYFLVYLFHFLNSKANYWIKGRKNIFQIIEKEVDASSPCAWFHFASLGEFEQGRPVMENLKKREPGLKIIITFFSPSGYELRKNYSGAEHIFYLPLDTKSNASNFIRLINPTMAVFTKYEFWYHYFNELNKRQIPLYIISGIFRQGQPFFKWYGRLNRKILSFVTHFFVQDEGSAKLLNSINLTNVTVSGDTRFDRVAENALQPKQFNEVKDFCSDRKIFIAGSTWPEDEKLISRLVELYPSWRFIIAPHEIKEEKIKAFINLLPNGSAVRHSQIIRHDSDIPFSKSTSVLIIDNIGMLSSLYQYAQVAYIGGGFGVGIHNTLEAAAFGIPVIFGPNFQKFLEARALLKIGGGFTIGNSADLEDLMMRLQDQEFRMRSGNIAGTFVRTQQGATSTILNFISR